MTAHLRTGQRAFNALDSLLPDLADRIRATDADPFHVDGRIEAFVGALAAEITALRAHITELEAPGECQSIHKLRAEVARLQVELTKPILLPWQKHGTREIWVRRDGKLSGLPLMVSERGWSAWLGAPCADVRGSETGEEGRRLADAAAVAAGWRLL